MGAVNNLSISKSISNDDLVNEYYNWLCTSVKIDTEKASYWFLAKALHKKKFYWFVPNDDNRASDGKKLREEFMELTNYDTYEAIEGECSMLEMLIALSKRMADIMFSTDSEEDISRWFWEMLSNVGLDKYSDEAYYENNGYENINFILDTILDRTYKRNGRGGLFPIKQSSKDQRKVELWYQMNTYLVEKYYNIDEAVV